MGPTPRSGGRRALRRRRLRLRRLRRQGYGIRGRLRRPEHGLRPDGRGGGCLGHPFRGRSRRAGDGWGGVSGGGGGGGGGGPAARGSRTVLAAAALVRAEVPHCGAAGRPAEAFANAHTATSKVTLGVTWLRPPLVVLSWDALLGAALDLWGSTKRRSATTAARGPPMMGHNHHHHNPFSFFSFAFLIHLFSQAHQQTKPSTGFSLSYILS